jgi:hypothetical protein
MRKILNAFLISQLTLVAANPVMKDPQEQIEYIQKLLGSSGNEELAKTLSQNQGKAKDLLANPDKLEKELSNSIDQYLDENLEDLNKIESD